MNDYKHITPGHHKSIEASRRAESIITFAMCIVTVIGVVILVKLIAGDFK